MVIRRAFGNGSIGTNMTTGVLEITQVIGIATLTILRGRILPPKTKDLGLLQCANLIGP